MMCQSAMSFTFERSRLILSLHVSFLGSRAELHMTRRVHSALQIMIRVAQMHRENA